jgi:hypothetical protein
MIEVTIIPTGDTAEAETPEDAVYAASVLLREARENGCSRPTAAFYVDGRLVRSDVSRVDLSTGSLS